MSVPLTLDAQPKHIRQSCCVTSDETDIAGRINPCNAMAQLETKQMKPENGSAPQLQVFGIYIENKETEGMVLKP